MTKKQNQKGLSEQEEKRFFENVEIEYKRSGEDVWKDLENSLESVRKTQGAGEETPTISLYSWKKLSIAASLLLLVTLGVFARFYTISISVGNGEFASQELPDGSIVDLNADSRISYHPYWWAFRRTVELEGEAFFDVEQGKKFKVVSGLGITEVLGTKFNIYARENVYEVLCETGKVGVSAKNGKGRVELTPGNSAFIAENGQIIRKAKTNKQAMLSWKTGKFIYNTTPLEKVFSDIERHYDVRIVMTDQNMGDSHYTGLFSRDVGAEEALQIICYSFGLQFEKRQGADDNQRVTYVILSE